MTKFNDQVQRLAAHVPNGELLALTDIIAFAEAVADKLDRLQAIVEHCRRYAPSVVIAAEKARQQQ